MSKDKSTFNPSDHFESIKGRKAYGGYIVSGSRKNQKYVHRIKMETFLGRVLNKDECIHHINGDKTDNKLENLEILSKKEHSRLHALENKLGKDRVGIPPTNKYPTAVIKRIIKERSKGKAIAKVAVELGISYPTVQKYCKENGLSKISLRKVKNG